MHFCKPNTNVVPNKQLNIDPNLSESSTQQNRRGAAGEPPGSRQGAAGEPPRNRRGTAGEQPGNRRGTAG